MFKTLVMTKKQLFFVIFIFSLMSCKTTYFPTSNHTPLFSEKGRVDISLGISKFGYELQPAYSISKTIALQSNLLYIWQMTDTSGFATRYGELAAGFNGKTKKFLYEIYGGYGIGRNYFQSTAMNTVRVNKLFVQPAIGRKDDFFLISGSTKLGLIRLAGNGQTSFSPVIEPNAHLRIGYKNIFFYTTLGLSYLPLGSDFIDRHLRFIFSAGLSFKF